MAVGLHLRIEAPRELELRARRQPLLTAHDHHRVRQHRALERRERAVVEVLEVEGAGVGAERHLAPAAFEGRQAQTLSRRRTRRS